MPKTNKETGTEEPWELKDHRKTCATYYDEHVPESSIEILGHSVGGITYRRPSPQSSTDTAASARAADVGLMMHRRVCPTRATYSPIPASVILTSARI